MLGEPLSRTLLEALSRAASGAHLAGDREIAPSHVAQALMQIAPEVFRELGLSPRAKILRDDLTESQEASISGKEVPYSRALLGSLNHARINATKLGDSTLCSVHVALALVESGHILSDRSPRQLSDVVASLPNLRLER